LPFAAVGNSVNAAAGRKRQRDKNESEGTMPKYLIEAHYTAEGAKGVAKDGGTGRRAAVVKAAESVGGKLESLYFAFGGVDVFAVIELPDNVTAAAMALMANQSGAMATKTIVLLTPEEMDKAAKKTVAYRAPGH
jgi:uncharacterized protein with GYD domain